MLQIRERDAGEHLVDAPFEQAPHGANAAGRRRIAAFSIDPVQVAVHFEGHVLRRFDDVFDADGLRRPGQQVAAARPTDGIDQTGAPQAQQNLLDIIVGESLLLGELTSSDRALPRALRKMTRDD